MNAAIQSLMVGMMRRVSPPPPSLQLTNQSVWDGQLSPTPASATYSLLNNGFVSPAIGNNWLRDGTASNYECVATLNSGTLTSGTVGSALNLGTSRSWNVTRSIVGTSSAQISIIIRPAGGGATIVSAVIDFTASVEP